MELSQLIFRGLIDRRIPPKIQIMKEIEKDRTGQMAPNKDADSNNKRRPPPQEDKKSAFARRNRKFFDL